MFCTYFTYIINIFTGGMVRLSFRSTIINVFYKNKSMFSSFIKPGKN